MATRATFVLVVALVGSMALTAMAAEPLYVTDFEQTNVSAMSPDSLKTSRDEADAYAQALNLAPLKDGDFDQVRLWVTWATFDPRTNGIATVGYVAAKRSLKCAVMYAGTSTKPNGGKCTPYTPRVSRERVLSATQHLSAFADVSIDCGILDGEWVLIDAVSGGKRFVVSAGNPQSCPGKAPKLVADLLNEVARR